MDYRRPGLKAAAGPILAFLSEAETVFVVFP